MNIRFEAAGTTSLPHYDVQYKRMPENDAFILRSPSANMGEPLAALCEQLVESDADIVKTQAGTYAVTIGPFVSWADAKKALDEITSLLGADHGFGIEQLLPDQSPQ